MPFSSSWIAVAVGALAWCVGGAPRAAHAKSDGGGTPPRNNVLGTPLERCCNKRPVGFYRDGTCRVGAEDAGVHAVCAVMTDEFLAYTKAQGNDLSTPRPSLRFPGLKAGDRWCLCVSRWKDAEEAGKAPRVDLAATDEAALGQVKREVLERYAIHAGDAPP